jgi:DNA polymerase III psi subunit
MAGGCSPLAFVHAVLSSQGRLVVCQRVPPSVTLPKCSCALHSLPIEHDQKRGVVACRQVEQLRCDIRRREWEDAAKKALSGKSSLTALQEALSDAPTMAASDSPLLTALRCRSSRQLAHCCHLSAGRLLVIYVLMPRACIGAAGIGCRKQRRGTLAQLLYWIR